MPDTRTQYTLDWCVGDDFTALVDRAKAKGWRYVFATFKGYEYDKDGELRCVYALRFERKKG